MPHKQTTARRLSDAQLEQLLRQRIAAGLPVDTKAIRGLGVAGGRCRVSRLRRGILTAEMVSFRKPRPGRPPSSAKVPPSTAGLLLAVLTALLRRGRVPVTHAGGGRVS